MHYFPLEDFPCDWAYTIDGGEVGELEYENFNAATAKITFKGRSIHPGYAKNKLVNALTLACEFQQGFPKMMFLKNIRKRRFFHLDDFKGILRKLNYII